MQASFDSNDIDRIGELVGGMSLLEVEYSLFSSSVQLLFGDDNMRVTLDVDHIHCIVFRQSLQGPHRRGFGPDCVVSFAGVVASSHFVDNYLSRRVGFTSYVVPYDLNNRTLSDGDYCHPRHLAVVCDMGHLDILFDSFKLHIQRAEDTH